MSIHLYLGVLIVSCIPGNLDFKSFRSSSSIDDAEKLSTQNVKD